MSATTRPLTEVTAEALALLSKELGVTNTVRFLQQFSVGHGNYTEERKSLFQGLALGDIRAEIRRDHSC